MSETYESVLRQVDRQCGPARRPKTPSTTIPKDPIPAITSSVYSRPSRFVVTKPVPDTSVTYVVRRDSEINGMDRMFHKLGILPDSAPEYMGGVHHIMVYEGNQYWVPSSYSAQYWHLDEHCGGMTALGNFDSFQEARQCFNEHVNSRTTLTACPRCAK